MTTSFKAKTAWLPVLRQVCSSADGFPFLLRQPLWRAVVHYAGLALACVLVNLACRALPARARLLRAVTAFDARFGRIVLGGGALSPAIHPENPRALSLGTLRVDYFPNLAAAHGFSPAAASEPNGVLWTPSALLLWQKFDERRCSVMPFPAAMIFPELGVRPELPVLIPNAGVAKHLELYPLMATGGGAKTPVADPARHSAPTRNLADFLPLGWGLLMLAVAAEGVLKAFFVAPSYIVMFCLVMHLFRPRGAPGLGLGGFLKLGLYAAFPGLIIAMLCTALELHVLEFHLVFSVAFLAWLFIVYGRVRRLTESPDADEEDLA